MRKGEVLSLDWSSVDLDHRVIHLERDKASGENAGRDVLLSDAACEVLRGLPRLARGGFVFFGKRRQGHLVDLEYFWEQALERAKLRHIRIHDLRHSYAASHVASGTSLHVIGKLLGHRDPKTSARYAHLSREAAMEAVDRVAGRLGDDRQGQAKAQGQARAQARAQVQEAKVTARYDELPASGTPRARSRPGRR